MATRQQVIDAVSNESISSSRGLMQRLFAFWFDAFVYNQIWEDPRVDLAALEINADSRMLTISSGGCNVLNYLTARPASITAVDLNRYHIYLLELKLAAAKKLPDHQSFFNFFGAGRHDQNLKNYQCHIAPALNPPARTFWESNGIVGTLLHGSRINYFDRDGLYQHSRNGYFLRFFHRFAHLVGLHPEKVLAAKTPAEQRTAFDQNIAPFFDSFIIRNLSKMPVTMFGLGIPPQQFDELKHDLADDKTLIDIYRERARRLACDFPIDENYFAWQAFDRRYDTAGLKAVPDYLKPANFEILRSGAFRVNTSIGSIADEIDAAPQDAFNRFVFLDSQDWMNAKTLTDLYTLIANKAENGSRIIFRTASTQSPLERSLPPHLLAKFSYQKELSQELFLKDRASIYGGFHLYILKK